MRTASATFNRETGKFTLVVGGRDGEPASRATAELPSVLHEGVTSIIRPHLASDPAIREAYLQVGTSYYGQDPHISLKVFVEADGTMLENERAFNWIRRNCAEHDLFFDLWVYNDYEMERLNVSGEKLEKTGHSLIYSRDAPRPPSPSSGKNTLNESFRTLTPSQAKPC